MTHAAAIAPAPGMNHADEVDTIARAVAGDDGAWGDLVAAHQDRIRAASRAVYTRDPDGAYGTALEAFANAVRAYDPASGVRFGAWAHSAMRLAVRAAAGDGFVIQLNDDALPRYTRLMRAANGDIGAAYRMAELGGTGLSPASLLAVHRVLRADGDIDIDRAVPMGDPAPEAVPADLVDELFDAVHPDDRVVVALRCGFRSTDLDAMRYRAGFHEDAALTDREAGVALGVSRMTVNRAYHRGLRAMRSHLQDAVDAGLRS